MRGINVGGKNRIGMNDLAVLFAEAGCSNVRTYIQSGNVLFDAPAAVLSNLGPTVSKQIETQFGFRAPVVLRSREELKDVLKRNPLLVAGTAPESLHVYFLSGRPTNDGVSALDPDRSPPDRFIVSGAEVFLQLPNGMGRTKLTNAYFDSKLKVVSTARNWQTVLKLCSLVSE